MEGVAKVDHHAGMCVLSEVTRLIPFSTHCWRSMIQVSVSSRPSLFGAHPSFSAWTGLPVVPGLVGQARRMLCQTDKTGPTRLAVSASCRRAFPF